MDREQGGYQEARAFLDGNNIYVWPVFEDLHGNMASKIGVSSKAIPLVIGFSNRGEIDYCMVTDHSRRTVWDHNPDVYQEIVSHPRLRSLSSSDLDVGYYDLAIVGDWRHLDEDSEEIEVESRSWYDRYIVSCVKKRKLKRL